MPKRKKQLFVTALGLEKLKKELQDLKELRLKEIAQKLKKALEFGDLSENAEYQSAKEEQGLIMARIAELEDDIQNVAIIEDQGKKAATGGIIQIGSVVTIQNLTEKEPAETYTIVGSTEADPLQGKISNESPIGEAILEKKKGDTIKIKVPAGEYQYKIVDVK